MVCWRSCGRCRSKDAEVELEVRADDGEMIHLKFVAYANAPTIAIDHPQSGIREIRLERLAAARVGVKDVPDHIQATSGAVKWIRQDIPGSPSIGLGLLPGETQSFATRQGRDDCCDVAED